VKLEVATLNEMNDLRTISVIKEEHKQSSNNGNIGNLGKPRFVLSANPIEIAPTKVAKHPRHADLKVRERV
jgi:hypothetical protein